MRVLYLRPFGVGLALVLLSCLQLASCAQQVGDIDRTQPGLLNKSLFDGEWFMRRTVIDVPYDAGYTFIGEQEEVVRVTWEIQKEHLVAYRAHPLIEGTNDSAPLAAFSITDHADIKREYNSNTGEQSNVIVENTSDRMWFERDFIRVDWSQNMVTNFSFYIDQLGSDGVAYYMEDGGDPERLLFGTKAVDGSWTDVSDPREIRNLDHADYFDVTTRIAVSPQTFLVEDWDGTIWEEPACWYYLNYDCAPATIAVRSSFIRVEAALSDYEPLDYPDNYLIRDERGDAVRVQWNAQGNREPLISETNQSAGNGGDQQQGNEAPSNPYGVGGDPTLVRMKMFDRFGYFRVERYGYDEKYGEVESKRIYLINRWNIWETSHDPNGNPLPYAQRTIRPIVYYLSPDFPEPWLPVAEGIIDQWDQAFRSTVTDLTGQDPGRIFQLKANTRKTDSDGKVIERGEANGDLRYSHLYLVQEPTRAGLLGYGPSAIDPLTGEIFAADAYIYGAVVKEVAAKGRDIVDLINGRLDPESFALGDNVTGYVAGLKAGGNGGAAPSSAKINKFVDEHRGAAPPKGKPGQAVKKHTKPKRLPTAAQLHSMPGIDRLKRPAGWTTARLAHARNTPLEDLLVADPAIQQLKGTGLHGALGEVGTMSPQQRKRFSPIRWASPEHRRSSLQRIRSFSERNMMMASFVDDAVAGLALTMKDKDSEVIFNELAAHIFRSTAEHEVGHTLGLRHNFEASTDALNYHPEYWALRGENPQPMAEMTPLESEGRLREYQYSSIMDYAGRFNADTAGIGYYDTAAIRFGYGQVIEVFETPPSDPLLDVVDYGDSFDRPYDLDTVLRQLRHYTKIPGIMGGVGNLGKRKAIPYTKKVAQLMGTPESTAYEAQLTGEAPWSNWAVPYRFCSDEYLFGTDTCYVYDMGADSYEVVTDAIDRYHNYYWFNNFKRDRIFFDEWDYQDRMWWRYFSFIHNAHQNWVFDQWFLADTWESLRYDADLNGIEDVEWAKALDGGQVQTAAVMKGYTWLNQIISMPEPGAYMFDFSEGYYWALDPGELPLCETEWAYDTDEWCTDANLYLGKDGRHLYSIYDWESGYYFYERLRWVGSFYDKLLALDALTNPDTYFLGVQSAESVDEWSISMYSSFPKEMRKLFGGIAADRFDLYAGVIEEDNWGYQAPDPFATVQELALSENYGVIDPSTSFTIQLYTLWYGLAWLNANFDNSFADLAKIWLVDGLDHIGIDDPSKVSTFLSPLNDRTYAAINSTDEDSFGTGALMIEKANEYKQLWIESALDPEIDQSWTEYYEWQMQNITENMEVVRGLHSLYGMLYF